MKQSALNRIRSDIPRKEKIEIAYNWIASWAKDQNKLIDRLGKAVSNDDFDEQSICVGQLREVTRKRFISLTASIETVFYLDRLEIQHLARKNNESN